MNSILPIISILLVLGGLIFVHELGHFLVARLFGIGVRSFSIGMGPKIIKKRFGKTEYCLSLLPIGGYVAIVGEEEGAELPEGFTKEESFTNHPAWQRLCIVLAGATFNIVLAVVLYFGIFYFSGKSYILPVVGAVTANSPANIAQIEPNDTILRINNIPITRFEQIRELTQINAGGKMTVVLRKPDGIEQTVELTPIRSMQADMFGEQHETWLVGIAPSGKTAKQELGLISSISEGFNATYKTLALTVEGFVRILQGRVSSDAVGGPIMIGQMIYSSAEQGIVTVFALAALISVNLGFLNLLPIPVLDGGHALFLTIEMFRGKPVSITWRERFTKFGFALLLLVMVFAMYNDVLRLFK